MFVIQRSKSLWLCTAKEAFDNHNVQLRLPCEYKHFDKFQETLENYERVEAGVITVYKCSDASKCDECPKCVGCKILKTAQETAQSQADFAAWAKANGGIVF